jgi:hypothetical protein
VPPSRLPQGLGVLDIDGEDRFKRFVDTRRLEEVTVSIGRDDESGRHRQVVDG